MVMRAPGGPKPKCRANAPLEQALGHSVPAQRLLRPDHEQYNGQSR